MALLRVWWATNTAFSLRSCMWCVYSWLVILATCIYWSRCADMRGLAWTVDRCKNERGRAGLGCFLYLYHVFCVFIIGFGDIALCFPVQEVGQNEQHIIIQIPLLPLSPSRPRFVASHFSMRFSEVVTQFCPALASIIFCRSGTGGEKDKKKIKNMIMHRHTTKGNNTRFIFIYNLVFSTEFSYVALR